MGLKEWIIPQDKAFFEILEKESANVLLGANKLEEAVKSFKDTKRWARSVLVLFSSVISSARLGLTG